MSLFDNIIDPRRLPEGSPVRCGYCNRFTRRSDARMYPDETGDYGHVYSYIVKCNREDCK